MVTVTAVLFLIATVLFVLAEMVNVSGANVTDGQRRSDATAAFFAAESGLETAEAMLLGAVTGGSITNATCTNVLGTVTGLPGATVSYSSLSTPPSCTGNACTSCAVTAIGQVGASTRTLVRSVSLATRNGVVCNGPVTNNCGNPITSPPVWKLNLKNDSVYNGVAVFNLAYTAKGNNAATCAAASNCQVQFDLGSPSAGTGSSGLMGNSVNIPAGATYPIYQVMDRPDRAVVEVGVIFKGTAAAPVLTGASGAGGASYWHTNSSGNGTVGSTDVTGITNDGTATATGSCSAPSASSQSCTNWCYGGDTLVFSYAAKVGGFADSLSSVTFGTGAGNQSVPLTQLAKFPTSLVGGAPSDVEAEIWSVSNPNLVGSSPLAANASSYKGRGSAAFGAVWTTINNNSNQNDTVITTVGTTGIGTLVIANATVNITNWPAQLVLPGDTIASTSGSTTVTATIGTQSASTETGATGQGGRGTYNVSNISSNGTLVTTNGTAFNGKNRMWTVSSLVLNVSGCTTCFFAASDALNGLVTGRQILAQSTPLGTVATRGRVEATAGVGRYTTTGGAAVQVTGTAQAGTPGATLYLPTTTTSLPAVTTPPMRLAIKTGTGALASNTTVVTAPVTANAVTRSFTVSAAPTTPLDNVSLCAGTCAFFVASGAATTTFTITKSAGTAEWASAFTCLKGVDVVPEPVTSSNTSTKRWAETIN